MCTYSRDGNTEMSKQRAASCFEFGALGHAVLVAGTHQRQGAKFALFPTGQSCL